MKPTSADLRQLRRDNLNHPVALAPVPEHLWPDPATSPYRSKSVAMAVWRSRSFIVVQWREPNGYLRLSVQRTEWDERKKQWREGVSWDDLQRLKAEAGFGDRCAVEVFPPDAMVVNVANMRHLFILPEWPPYLWTGGK